MIDDNGDKRSLVLPKWLDYTNAIRTGELFVNTPAKHTAQRVPLNEIDYLLNEFTLFPNVFLASEIMGAAIITEKIDIAHDMAKFILNKGGVNNITKHLAAKTLSKEEIKTIPKPVNERIRDLKEKIFLHPHNSVCWMDIGRLYTIKGQTDKARKAVMVALNLGPQNRFLIRSGTRFFMHIGEIDIAHYYIKKALQSVSDPWIKSLDVSISQRLNKRLGKLKRILPGELSKSELFNYSELYESCGMLELAHGHRKKAKSLFSIAWKNPSESVIRHGEWVIRNEFPTLRHSPPISYDQSKEAMAWHYFYNLNINVALEYILEWELEEPYSASPYILGSHVGGHTGDYSNAISFAKRGLESNPQHFMLKNNLCYNLINSGQIDEAKRCINSIPSNLDEVQKLFYNATRGLLEFKLGNIENGNALYSEAIAQCRKLKNNRLITKAKLNLAIAECENKTDSCSYTADQALKLSKGSDNPTTILLRNRLQKLLNIS